VDFSRAKRGKRIVLQVSKLFVFLMTAILLSGCKLAVIVVEGGEVFSRGTGFCVAGAICIHDVSDPNFSEVFQAVPDNDNGWYFQRWNSGDRFFCGDSTDTYCRLSFEGHEESEAVEELVASDEVFYLMPVFKQFSDTILIDDKQWYQPYLFSGLSWEDINAVCPAGECAGVLNGYDMTGWTWASIEDVNALFNHYLAMSDGRRHCGQDNDKMLGPGPGACFERGSAWADAFFSDGWRPTSGGTPFGESHVSGWMRDLSQSGESTLGGIVEESQGVFGFDFAFTDSSDSLLGSEQGAGGWFYRNP
jgi:hypothetical protein